MKSDKHLLCLLLAERVANWVCLLSPCKYLPWDWHRKWNIFPAWAGALPRCSLCCVCSGASSVSWKWTMQVFLSSPFSSFASVCKRTKSCEMLTSPSRNCMPSRTWAVWHIPGDDMHLPGLIKQVTQLQWILSRNIFSILQWEIFLSSWFLWTLKLAYLTHTRYCWPIRRKFLPSALPWQFEILSTFCILWTSQTICKQTAAAQKEERNFTIKGEIKLVSCSPAFDF